MCTSLKLKNVDGTELSGNLAALRTGEETVELRPEIIDGTTIPA